MGANFAHDLASGEFSISLEDAISLHLTNNHYPPVPSSMVPVCVQAIYAVNESNYNETIYLPEGVTWRGYVSIPAHEVVKAFHLDAWVESEEY